MISSWGVGTSRRAARVSHRFGFARRGVGGRAAIVREPTIRRPLRDPAQHVEKPERIGRQRIDRQRAVGVLGAAAIAAIRQRHADRIAPPVARGRPAPRRIFPFRLARQPIGVPRGRGQPRIYWPMSSQLRLCTGVRSSATRMRGRKLSPWRPCRPSIPHRHRVRPIAKARIPRDGPASIPAHATPGPS